MSSEEQRASLLGDAFGAGKYMVVHPHDINAMNADLGSGNVASLNADETLLLGSYVEGAAPPGPPNWRPMRRGC